VQQHRDAAWWTLTFVVGLRQSEALALRWTTSTSMPGR